MTYYQTRPAEALTNALERLMIAITNQELEQSHVTLCEYRRACDLLGYDPKKAQWAQVQAVNGSGFATEQEYTVDYYPMLNPEE